MANGESVAEITYEGGMKKAELNPEKYQKIKSIFNRALEMPSAERGDFVSSTCEDTEMRLEVEKMLAFADDDSESDILEKNAFQLYTNGDSQKIPEQIGDYKIVREIGRGGMGAVYEAVRKTKNFTQHVALKIIKRGMDTDAILSRFRHEQQILASLEHPNIARFLDGGMTDDDLPFYAMEFVEGEFIDDYCRKNDCSVKDKIELFRKVCDAVGYAHQNLVVHRDLKPKNILVCKDGTPKLLDFGIGKILTPENADVIGTATQFGMMTPAYASPEQILGGRIGTSSDIYSLGVILYEILTGEKPYKVEVTSQIELHKAILENAPSKPSAVQNSKLKVEKSKSNPKSKIRNPKSLSGDLDNIILKTLRKKTENRYSSVQEFSEDLRRYLVGLPVSARPLTLGYRASKFYKRNKMPVIAGLLIVVSLLTGIVISVWQANEARAAELRAERRFREVRELANNVIFKYHDAIAELPGATATREMLVSDALKYLDNLTKDAENNTELGRELAAAYLKLGDVQGKQYEANLGDTASAEASYRKAAALLENVTAKEPENLQAKSDLVRVYEALFATYMRNGKPSEERDELLEKSQKISDELIGAELSNIDFQIQKLQLLSRKGDSNTNLDEKFAEYSKAIEIAEKLLPGNSANEELLQILVKLHQRAGTAKIWSGDEALKKGKNAEIFYRDALPFHKRSMEMGEKLYLENLQNISNRRRFAVTLINFAETSAKNGNLDEASLQKGRELFKKAVDEDLRNLEAKSDFADLMLTEAKIYESLDKINEAVKSAEKSLELFTETYQTDKVNLESLKSQYEIADYLSKLCSKSGNQQKAAFYLKKNQQILKVYTEIVAQKSEN